MLEQLLKPEAKEERREILKEAGYSDGAIEAFEDVENQKEKLEALKEAMDILRSKGNPEEVVRRDRANGYSDVVPSRKHWPTFGD